eukprot:TRINITY_DN11277_c0_g1_i1.p1 TRINITY_DN11277_c0_g1~~TRINITY_DN11277_c0_g1_i1.p1  ORF type:complete len:253 (+),score=86.68 TRINITY_DN11277_c0_g1_i1:85-843(+)
MQDPFESVKGDVVSAVKKVEVQYSKWSELQASDDDREFEKQHSQLLQAVHTIEWDLNDLGDAIQVVLHNRKKFETLSDKELNERKKFVEDMRQKLAAIQADVSDPRHKTRLLNTKKEKLTERFPSAKTPTKDPKDKYTKLADDGAVDNEEFIQQQLQQQRDIEMQQEGQIDDISHAVGRLKQTGIEIHEELKVHDELLNDLEGEMDSLGSKLKHATKKVEHMLKNNQDKGKLCCIGVLILVLITIICLFFFL